MLTSDFQRTERIGTFIGKFPGNTNLTFNNIPENEVELYNFIFAYTKKHMRPPTMREMTEKTSINSTSTVNEKVKKLTRLGLLSIDECGKITVPALMVVERENFPYR